MRALKQVANCSGLSDEEIYCNEIGTIPQYRYFELTPATDVYLHNIWNVQKSTVKATCPFKSKLQDPWDEMQTGGISNYPSVLRYLRNLRRTPPEILRSPQDKNVVMNN